MSTTNRKALREAIIRDLTINEFLRHSRKCVEKEIDALTDKEVELKLKKRLELLEKS